MSNPLSIASRLWFTSVVKAAIIRGLDRGLNKNYSTQEKERITLMIIDELGKSSEELMGIVRQFFEKSGA